jgi:O-antigen ligase
MNVRALRQFPSVLLMSAFFAAFVSYLDHHLEARGALPFKNVSMFLWALAAMTAGTVLRAAASPRERARLITLYRMHVGVLAPLGAVVLCSFASAFLPTANLDEGPRYVLYPAYNAAIVVLSMLLPFPEHHRKRIRWYLAIAFALAAASVFVDVIRPGTFSILPDRAAGFARNPNGGSFLLIALCCSMIVFDRVRGVDLVVLGVTALGVIATLSRGGAVLLALVVCCYVPCVVRDAARRGVGVVVIRLAALLLLVGGTYAATSRLIDQRMFAGTGSRVGMLLGTQQVVGPRESRIGLLAESWELVREAPLLGYGSGFTFAMPQGPHNIYLSRWLDNGLAGVVSYTWLLAACCLTFWRRRHAAGLVFMAVVVIEGFFSHNLLDERVFLLLIGVLLTLSAYGATERAVAPQSARRIRPALGLFERAGDAARSAPVALPQATSPRPR